MTILKIWFHLCALISKCFYKVIYSSKLKIGKGTTWRRKLLIMISDKGNIKIGENCFFNNYCSLNSNIGITIGENCLFGENVKIYDHNHKFADASVPIKRQGFSNAEVMIGDNCWIGSNVTILKGAKIGNHCVIGAGVVINGIIPDNTIVKSQAVYTLDEIISK